MAELGRNTTRKRIVNFWRIRWTVSTLVLVEIIVCGLSAIPAVILWSLLSKSVSSSPRLQLILLSSALIPSYISFALALLFVSPLAIRLVGWRTPAHAEMRIADLDWQLLNFVRYAAANHFRPRARRHVLPGITSLDDPFAVSRCAAWQASVYQQPRTQ